VSEVFELGPTRLWVVAATEGTTILGAELQPRAGSPWHTHTREDETIVVVSGELVVDDGERRVLTAGDAHLLARGVRHTFENQGSAVARVCFVCAPGGLEKFFREVARGQPPNEAASRAGLVFE
jgi:quercetin dioxygenase-like cupin family protein